jgi:hypothetical protein
MTCDELELLLPEGAEDAAAQAHLAGCARCRQTLEMLSAAAQPAPGASEKAKLVGLASAVQSQWVRQQQRRGRVQSALGLAIAASVGAVLAIGAMWNRSDVQLQPQPAAQMSTESEVLVWMEDASPVAAADDEASFEVAWPSLNEEGDVL